MLEGYGHEFSVVIVPDTIFKIGRKYRNIIHNGDFII